ncbi:BTB/POZ domain-containing protein KCTD14 [Neolamprologus brichardi]|uniref:BTB/POZ domain-containing protein KCTD14 n=1 Tax=Neolamprologus brichardi TaxID=32507 RepID=UPI001643ED87|nr:BTB/POZ domain-containing protein KCTD14 [Neolamprologus brichardi]
MTSRNGTHSGSAGRWFRITFCGSAPVPQSRGFFSVEDIEAFVLIRIARAEAIAARYSYITICVLRTEEDLGFYDNAINSLDAAKESVVTFGPWKAALLVEDLLDCVKMDIESQGYRVSIQPHAVQHSFLSRSYRNYFHQLTFTWW